MYQWRIQVNKKMFTFSFIQFYRSQMAFWPLYIQIQGHWIIQSSFKTIWRIFNSIWRYYLEKMAYKQFLGQLKSILVETVELEALPGHPCYHFAFK